MTGFMLELRSAQHTERIADVTGFVGADATGSFGIMPGRARFMTVLEFGLSRFRIADGTWRYLACPGAVLRFDGDCLTVSTRRYLYDADYERISEALAGQLAEEERSLKTVKDNLQALEQTLIKRLRALDRWPS